MGYDDNKDVSLPEDSHLGTVEKGNGEIVFRRDQGTAQVKIFTRYECYDDWQLAHDVAQAIYFLPELMAACDKARRLMSDEQCREADIDYAYDRACDWYGTADGSCGVHDMDDDVQRDKTV